VHQDQFKGTLVTGVIGEDSHSIGIKILEHSLSAAEFKVVPLGIQVTQQEFVEAAVETDADAILVSSLNGHAPIACEGLRDRCIETGLGDILLYLGGMLYIRDKPWEEVEKLFQDMGFDRVYTPACRPGHVINDLLEDLTRTSRN